ncbi:MAG: hypothetical protein QW343_00525 [Candidatus Norongarragalinales archaeon]
MGYLITEKLPGKPLNPNVKSTYEALAFLKQQLTRHGFSTGRDFGPHHVFKISDGKLGLIDVELYSYKNQRAAF